MKLLIVAVIFFSPPVSGRAGAADEARQHNAEQLADFQAVSYTTAKAAFVAKLVEKGKGSFHGLKLASDWQELDAGAQAGLAGLLRQPIDAWIKAYSGAGDGELVNLDPFCIPVYGYAVRLETDKGTREFAICLRCGQIFVLGDRKHGVEFAVKDEPLVRLKAYYLDEFVLKQGLAKKP